VSDAIAILESAYSLEGSEDAWLARVAETVRRNIPSCQGVRAQTYDLTRPGAVAIRSTVNCCVSDEMAGAGARIALREDESAFVVSILQRSFVGSLRDSPRALRRAGLDEGRAREFRMGLEQFFRQWKQSDQWWVNAQDPTKLGCIFMAPVTDRGRPRPREVHQWRCIAAHVVAAFRIRRQLVNREPDAPGAVDAVAEAVLTPSGRVEHAAAAARGEGARTSLSEAVRAIDRARGSLRRKDPQKSVELWRALVAGRWSLLDHFDSDGRRFVLAHRNDARLPEDARGLTLRERQVLAHLALGHSNKVIAYELGLAQSTVAGHMARARRKLELPSAAALQNT
jgi:DNA-binding CsgD family transcriptional regulator